MQRNCEKINHRWFHNDKFVNRVCKSDLQGIFIILTPRIKIGKTHRRPRHCTHVKVRFCDQFGMHIFLNNRCRVVKLSSHSLLIFNKKYHYFVLITPCLIHKIQMHNFDNFDSGSRQEMDTVMWEKTQGAQTTAHNHQEICV